MNENYFEVFDQTLLDGELTVKDYFGFNDEIQVKVKLLSLEDL